MKKFFQKNFVYNGKEKLSKLSILAIIFLDIFILSVIYQGIDFQTKVINTPEAKFPYECRDVLTYDTAIEDFNNYLYGDGYNYDSKYQDIKDLEVDKRCNLIFEKISLIKKEINIDDLKKRSEELYTKEYSLIDQISYIKSNYNTVLFEKISVQKSDKSIIKGNINSENIKQKYDLLNKEIDKLSKEKENLNLEFKNNNLIKDLVLYLQTNKKEILDDISKSEKYYYVKQELIVLLFLIPLVVLFFYLMKRYLAKEKYILYVMFKNIFIISLIPTLISIFSLIYEFLPKIFLEKLMQFFYELEIPFVVYYFVIIIFVFIFGFLIIKVQKRYKENNNKLKNNSISKVESYNKNICNSCGNSVDFKTMNFCPCCQNQLKIECKFCQHKTIKGLSYCSNCGQGLE
mgnify:CR=1 FL=1